MNIDGEKKETQFPKKILSWLGDEITTQIKAISRGLKNDEALLESLEGLSSQKY